MRKSRFTEEQIIKVLKDMQLVCRLRSCAGSTASASRHSTSGRSRYGGMEVSDACKLKALEDKNRQTEETAGGADAGCIDTEGDARKNF